MAEGELAQQPGISTRRLMRNMTADELAREVDERKGNAATSIQTLMLYWGPRISTFKYQAEKPIDVQVIMMELKHFLGDMRSAMEYWERHEALTELQPPVTFQGLQRALARPIDPQRLDAFIMKRLTSTQEEGPISRNLLEHHHLLDVTDDRVQGFTDYACPHLEALAHEGGDSRSLCLWTRLSGTFCQVQEALKQAGFDVQGALDAFYGRSS